MSGLSPEHGLTEVQRQERPLLQGVEQNVASGFDAPQSAGSPHYARRSRSYYRAAAALFCMALVAVAFRSAVPGLTAARTPSGWDGLSMKAQPDMPVPDVPKGGDVKDNGSHDDDSHDDGSKDGGSKDGGSKDGGSKDDGSKGGGSVSESKSVHLNVEKAKALGGHAQCGRSEKDLDYEMDGSWYDHFDGIPTAETCCQQCEDSPACTSWTFVEDAKLRGSVPSQCWFKSGKLVRKNPKKGVQSGLLVKGPPPQRPAGDGPTLYCWSVMRVDGYEKSLVRDQMAHGASIFACDGYSVFSENRTWLTKGPPMLIETEVLAAGLNLAKGGATTASWVNTESFFRAWEKIRIDRRYLDFDWVVKVDPDCVFFPLRLKRHLAPYQPKEGRPEPLYMYNCGIKAADGFGMYGSLETVSSSAVDVYLAGLAKCQGETGWRNGWGEDYFLQMCLDKLGVKHVRDYGTLKDSNCLYPSPSPCTSGQAAFHPFKSSPGYWSCWTEAGGHHADEGVGPNKTGRVLPPSDASGKDEDEEEDEDETSTLMVRTTAAAETTTAETTTTRAAEVLGSCDAYGCTEVFMADQACQCNSQCGLQGNCCGDYSEKCVKPAWPQVNLGATWTTAAPVADASGPVVDDWVQVDPNVEDVQGALAKTHLKWSAKMLPMLGKNYQVVKAPQAGFIGLPSPNGSQGGVWYFPASVVHKVR